jgi:hypothetical protein
MNRKALIKEIALNYIEGRGLSKSLITGYTSEGRAITQLEEIEINLGTLTNYRLLELGKRNKKV